ncbi:MAG: L,D-transpeptidase [Lachnospiraceae bacterium]|nr:L,D-transpeptidase [Lachnospiraceae bacterium]
MKKALITITLILSALAVTSAVLVLHYFATKKVKVVERPAYVFNIPAIDQYTKYVVTTTTQWKDVKVDNKLVFDPGIKAAMEKYNESSPDPENAYIKREGELYVVVPEVEGKDLDIERSLKEQRQIRIEPSVRQDALTDLCERANQFVTWSVTYDNGDSVRSSIDYVTIEGDEIHLDDSFIDVQLENVVYNPVGSGADFVNSYGIAMHVDGGTWGSSVNTEEETVIVKDLFHRCESVAGRHPVFDYEQASFISGDYIEISIDAQHMWLYRDGQLVIETDVVTGDSAKNRHTPRGVYYIIEKLKEKWMNGGEYLTLAHRWMRLTWSGVGIHDAWWRYSFGGNIYTYDGSHGCINTPSDAMNVFYDNSYEMMPVVIY